jgi:hypothetical protein
MSISVISGMVAFMILKLYANISNVSGVRKKEKILKWIPIANPLKSGVSLDETINQ